MRGKYANVTIKPTIPASIQQAGTWNDGLILFDWTEFVLPNSTSRLLNSTLLVRGKDGADQSSGNFDIELFFAKKFNNTAPPSLGSIRAAVSTAGWMNHMTGTQFLDVTQNNITSTDNLIHMHMLSSGNRAGGPDVVLHSEKETHGYPVENTVYVAAVFASSTTCGFSTTVLSRGGTAAGELIIETDKGANDDPDADLIFAPGDVLATTNGTDDRTLGTVKSISAFGSSKQDINFELPTTSAIADNEEVYNLNPVTLRLSFEN